ncbi:MAG TPA: RHS repeat-associated core domain-containing protein [Candidatus Dormibacteraeota bacterium]|nr:RHS repeat-associated core domain-containing protein [Candidatus Dormibacteraeota bacterium]
MSPDEEARGNSGLSFFWAGVAEPKDVVISILGACAALAGFHARVRRHRAVAPCPRVILDAADAAEFAQTLQLLSYLHQDQLGSTRFLTDGSGSTVATYGYDPYGNLTALTGNVGTAIGFAGQYTDAETGFQYLQARYYDPLTGQFVSKDPITWATGRPYGYTAGNPTNFVDPSGLDQLHDIWNFLSNWATPIGLLASVASLVFGLIPPLFGLSVFFDLLSTAMSVVQAINDAASGNWWEAAIAIAAGIAGSAALFFKLAAKAKEAVAAAREGVSVIVYIRTATFSLLAEYDIGGMARLAWQLAKVKEIRSTVISKALDAIGALLWALHKATEQSQSNPAPSPQPTPQPPPGPAPGPQPGPAPAPAC